MVTRRRRDTVTLAVTFLRDGEEPVRIEAVDGEKALLRAIAMLMKHRRLQAGDHLIVTAAE